MKKNFTRLILILVAGTQLLFFQNCSKVSVSDIEAPSASTIEAPIANNIVQGEPLLIVPSCTEKLEYVTKPVKIMFLVDRSWSNIIHPDYPGGPDVAGTDEGKVWRQAVISQIIGKYGANKSISFGMISFQGTLATAHIKSLEGKAIFTNDQAIIQAGFKEFLSSPDISSTPYQEALFAARDAIKADIATDLSAEKAAYSVVMLSDGIPSTAAYRNNPQAVIVDAQAIMDLSPGMIRLNSVFYSNESVSLSAQQFLKNISTTGQGVFLVANSKEPFVLNNLVEYANRTCE